VPSAQQKVLELEKHTNIALNCKRLVQEIDVNLNLRNSIMNCIDNHYSIIFN
jgi:hypothetical protein